MLLVTGALAAAWVHGLPTASARQAAPAAATQLPAALARAEYVSALPGGAWLALEKRGLRLVDAAGVERARLDMRAKHLDSRPTPQGALALVLEADTQRTLAIDVDLQRMQMVSRGVVASPNYSVEAMCQYRDRQGLDHLFLIGDEGLTEQWVLRGDTALLVRRLALPPQSRQCAVDDRTQRLFVLEEGVGVSAFNADAEAKPRRQVVTPAAGLSGVESSHGVAAPAKASGAPATAITSWPGGVAVLDAGGSLQLWQQRGAAWALVEQRRLMAAGSAHALALRIDGGAAAVDAGGGAGGLTPATDGRRAAVAPLLVWRDKSRKQWFSAPMARTQGPQALDALPIVLPRVQTAPVARFGDAADDPAVWVHPGDATRSLVIGTNKKQGLLAYDLAGRQRQLLEVGRVNNVDLRQRVRFAGYEIDIAVATQRDDLSVVMFGIDAEGTLREIGRVATGLQEIYGVCLHQPRSGGLELFVNDKDGSYQRHRLQGTGDATTPRISARLVQRFKLASQPEACVADDVGGVLFIGEEKRGVWALSLAEESDSPALRLVVEVGGGMHAAAAATSLPDTAPGSAGKLNPSSLQKTSPAARRKLDDSGKGRMQAATISPLLHADVEGLGLYHGTPGAAATYLVVSSQGNNSYVVLDASPPYAVRGAFRIGMNLAAGIDGVSETDGLEVVSVSLGPDFPRGALVVQDGFKRLPDAAQNFKLVDWRDIAAALRLP